MNSGLQEKFVWLHQSLAEVTHADDFFSLEHGQRLNLLMRLCSERLPVARASTWRLDAAGEALMRDSLYQAEVGVIDPHTRLLAADFPRYFAALRGECLVNAEDARADARTSEFVESYLEPLHIGAMLDTPIFVGGALRGVVCLEHLGGPRQWDIAEMSFAAAVAATVSLSLAHESWKAARRRADFLALHDDLTGLPNRHVLEQRLDALAGEPAGAPEHALLWVDLDRFKDVNDGHGHAVGDEVLRQVGRRLQGCCVGDRIEVFRLNGDEFAMLVEAVDDPEHLGTVLARVMGSVQRGVNVANLNLDLSASMGVALFPKDSDKPHELLRFAEMAMYRAKRNGPSQLEFFVEDWARQLLARFHLEQELRAALRRQEFVLFYQPIVRADTWKPVEVEALVRWRRPGHGLQLPDTFLPILRSMGRLAELGSWVLRQAVADLNDLLDAGYELQKVSVNVAAEQLAAPELVDEVRAQMRNHDSARCVLEMEITEELIGAEHQMLESKLRSLGELGVGLAIDDFGTGYSSLSRLKHMPVSKLKIDRSFVAGLPDSAEDRSLCRSIIGLGKGLGLSLVAEGVENVRQAQWLEANGCDLLQGFVTAPPMERAALERFLSQPVSKAM